MDPTPPSPYQHLVHGQHHSDSGEESDSGRDTLARLEERMRAQLIDEMEEQAALERFQAERPDLWLQVQRIGRLLDMQRGLEDEVFPPGSCFLHAGLPNFSQFSVKQILEVNLESCQATIEIYADEDLEAGIVIIPLEVGMWFGFPAKAVPLHFDFQGFTYSASESAEAPGKAQPADTTDDGAPPPEPTSAPAEPS